MPNGTPGEVGTENVPVTVPPVFIRLMLLDPDAVNHRFPSDPGAIAYGWLAPTGNSVKVPAVVISPIWFALYSVNHRLPLDPVVIPFGPLLAVGTLNEEKTPDVVTRPM